MQTLQDKIRSLIETDDMTRDVSKSVERRYTSLTRSEQNEIDIIFIYITGYSLKSILEELKEDNKNAE
jgi:hypothetical protein